MSNFIIAVIVIAILFFAVKGSRRKVKGGCCGAGGSVKKIKPADANASHYKYKSMVFIDGMTCEHCKTRVENSFNSESECMAKVDLANKSAEVWTNRILSEEEVDRIVKKHGYDLIKYLPGK